MAKINLENVAGGYNLSAINNNFDLLEQTVNENMLSRAGVGSNPNEMKTPLDMNSNRIYNVPDPIEDHEAVNKGWLEDHVQGGPYQKNLRVNDVNIPALPDAAGRANKLLTFDSQGNPQVQFPASDSATQLRIDLSQDDGADLIGFIQEGEGAIAKSVLDKDREIVSNTDYSELKQALDFAIATNRKIEVRNNLTVRIPSDCLTLQLALNHISPAMPQLEITLLIEAGHELTQGVLLQSGNYSNFKIKSESAEVLTAVTITGDLFKGIRAVMPTLSCLINLRGYGNNGILLDQNSSMLIEPNCGITYSFGTGLLVQNGSSASARNTIWRYSGQNGVTGAGITAWCGFVDAEGADVSFSVYYGAQAAHGGTLNFRNGNADDVGRYGIRATDRASIDFDLGRASRCGVYGIYAFQNSTINAPSCVVTDCGSVNVIAVNASSINARSSTLSGVKKTSPAESNYGYNVYVNSASSIDVFNAIATNAADTGLVCEGASSASAGGIDVTGALVAGIVANTNGTISARLAKADSCTIGFRAIAGGVIAAPNAQAQNCSNSPAIAEDGGEINIPDGILIGGGTQGVRAVNGSKLNIPRANCQRGESPDSTDIQCFSGSIINANLSIGGMNRTANSLSAQGVIFKP